MILQNKGLFTPSGVLTFTGAVNAVYDGWENKTVEIPQSNSKRTCRFVVGTSASGWIAQDCDYLCDGVDDQVEINNAIQALPSTGGEVVILDGTYNITASVTIDKGYTTLTGNGEGTILKRAAAGTATNPGIIVVTSNYNVIRGLTVDGNKETYSSTGNYNVSIRLTNSSNNTITGNTCKNNQSAGIYLSASVKNKIIENTVIDNVSYGIVLQSGCSNNIISGNMCSTSNMGISLNTTSTNNAIVGNMCIKNNNDNIYISTSRFNLIDSNICVEGVNGITLTGSGTYENTVCGNVCNNNRVGINIAGASDNTITGNMCYSNVECGIVVSSSGKCNTISGNHCSSNTLSGIDLGSQTQNSTVGDNACRYSEVGIRLYNTKNNTIVGNSCYNNDIGIKMESVVNSSLIGNTCIRDNWSPSYYDVDEGTITLVGSENNNNFISNNFIFGKNYTSEGGTGNTFVNNKYN